MQSHDGTNVLRICTILNQWTQNRRNWDIFHLFVTIWQSVLVLCVFMTFLTLVSAQNCQSEHFNCAKELAFRKSEPKLVSIWTFVFLYLLGSHLRMCQCWLLKGKPCLDKQVTQGRQSAYWVNIWIPLGSQSRNENNRNCRQTTVQTGAFLI